MNRALLFPRALSLCVVKCGMLIVASCATGGGVEGGEDSALSPGSTPTELPTAPTDPMPTERPSASSSVEPTATPTVEPPTSSPPSGEPTSPTTLPSPNGGSGGSGGAPPDSTLDAGNSPAGAGGIGGSNDAGTGCVPFVMPDDCTVPDGAVLPGELRCTGLYADWETRELHCGVQSYTPAYTLWSDGSDKQRYFSVPEGSTVDMSDAQDFRYPIGTKFWKEFRAPGGGRLLETRLLESVDGGWLYTSYVWTEDESNAIQNNDGVPDLYATGHTVPARQQCKECHSGRPDYVLGWDAVLLGEGASGVTRDLLVDAPWATWPGKAEGMPPPLDVTVPGDETERAALGYLHANCGVSCHNDTTNALALETGFFTRLDSDSLGSVQQTLAFTTGYLRTPSPNAPLMDLEAAPNGAEYVDLRPLDTEASLLLVRMKLRNVDAAMPRIGTNLIDEQGVALVQAWIEGMTEERGYPPAMP